MPDRRWRPARPARHADISIPSGGTCALCPLAACGQPQCRNGYTARCPAHEDRTPSLSVGPGRDQTVSTGEH